MSGQYRLEIASQSRAGCQNGECKKAGIKIQKGELRHGVFVTIKDYQSWKWKHWGCVTPQVLEHMKDALEGNYDFLDGYDELPEAEQTRVRMALDDGHVADEDWKGDVEVNRPGRKGFRMPASMKKRQAAEADQAGAGDEATPSKPKGKKRSRAKNEESGEDIGHETPSPKKAKAAPKKGKNVKKEIEKDEEAPSPPKRGRKKAAKVKAEASNAEIEELPKPRGRPHGKMQPNGDDNLKREGSESESVQIPYPARKTRAPRKAAPKRMKEESESDDPDAGLIENDGADDAMIAEDSPPESASDAPKAKKGRKNARKVTGNNSKGNDSTVKMPSFITNPPSYKADILPKSSLPTIPAEELCHDFIAGFCRRGDTCQLNHKICIPHDAESSNTESQCAPNYLIFDRRDLPKGQSPFDDEGPGSLSSYGIRHDNDHGEIHRIQILPTMDEILSRRPPFVPRKSPQAFHHLPAGQKRHLDVLFRQSRYEKVEPLIDASYHACQHLVLNGSEPQTADYDDRMITPRRLQYSLFQDVAFEEVQFNPTRGMMVRISYACPRALRGKAMGLSKHLEEGMLVALIGFCNQGTLSVTYMEVDQRQTTESMRRRSGNNLRGMILSQTSAKTRILLTIEYLAALVLSFAEPSDIDAVRRLLYNYKNVMNEKFVLVEVSGLLYAGFRHTLKRLQDQSASRDQIAFLSSIAPLTIGMDHPSSPPAYATEDHFEFQLNSICTTSGLKDGIPYALRPFALLSGGQSFKNTIDELCNRTTLDRGQAEALCETLCRGLAFTQGPPGTGKTFLGVALARVLLASRGISSMKPILVVCLTNHALDSFLADLKDAGIVNFARLGSKSKEAWTHEYDLRKLTSKLRKSVVEKSATSMALLKVEALYTEAVSWSESLNSDTLSWPAVREHLAEKNPAILSSFTDLESVDQQRLSDIRLARKAGGFAFEYWCSGGDLKEVESLMKHFITAVQSDPWFQTYDPEVQSAMERLKTNIHRSVGTHADRSASADIWRLSLVEREQLFKEWKEDIAPRTILDRTAEIHRRHQVAVSRKRDAFNEVEIRSLANQDIIAMTTTVCARQYHQLKRLGIEIVICEEAAEVMEAQFMCSLLPTVQHSISIGDPLQLRSANPNSFSNEFEVEMVAGLVEYLVKSNEYDYKDITVLTPYNGQLAAFNERFRAICSLWLSEKDREALIMNGYIDPMEDMSNNGETILEIGNMLKIATIDNFQGSESRIVILSTVRSNSEGRPGFLKTPNRINVGCSRARDGFYIIGNASLMDQIPMWHQVLNELVSTHNVGAEFRTCCPRHPDVIYGVGKPEQWYTTPECHQPCTFQFACGHKCPLSCHADILHERQGCSEPKYSVPHNMRSLGVKNPVKNGFLAVTNVKGYATNADASKSIAAGRNAKRKCLVVISASRNVMNMTRTVLRARRSVANLVHTEPCGHHFDVEFLDKAWGLGRIYEMDSDGNIRGVVTVNLVDLLELETFCPECGVTCAGLRRYAIFYQIRSLKSHVDWALAHFNKRIFNFLGEMNRTRGQLASSFDAFCSMLKPGPLAGKHNEILVLERGNALSGLEGAILKFKGMQMSNMESNELTFLSADLVERFEQAVASLIYFLKSDTILEPYVFASSLRLESLIYRCQLTVLELHIQMLAPVRDLGKQSAHSELLAQGLKHVIIPAAAGKLQKIKSSIEDCQARGLKRLETELHLVDSATQIFLKGIEPNETLTEAANAVKLAEQICKTYPLTAGLFQPCCEQVNKHLRGRQRNSGHPIYAKATQDAWWSWTKHVKGSLLRCDNGHPYSGVSMAHCLECGPAEEVKVPKKKKTGTLLVGQDFMNAYQTARRKNKFDPSAYGLPNYKPKPKDPWVGWEEATYHDSAIAEGV
ncbi:uncharacterized protein KY384_000554 [Bacidia gigantensis]|uniref:uncharacterized protein n=1 Tax=Bacidia gigantensis TaxID=2732470 RepID=UPI001D04A0A0|nr:uncharacterized protein KY384_000554 [Bacidia gigantensis]KAG8525794.1 hypothetical protein KY384_000554 [Bacidia gigantensis]